MEKEANVESNNVVSLFSRLNAADKKAVVEIKAKQEDDGDFDAVMQKNHEVSERMRKERAKANKAVLRSYRIKT